MIIKTTISSTTSQPNVKNLIKKTVSTIARSFGNALKNEAIRELGNSAESYVAGIHSEEDGDKSTISIEGLGGSMEGGSGPYDMKPGFARSPKRKISKDGGWYLDIPFKHSRVPAGIMKALKDKPLVHGVQGGMATDQLKYKELPTYHRRKSTRQELFNTITGETFPAYKRKSPIFESVRRVVGKQGQHFETFRRVSDKSAPHSWIHPGFRGKGGIANKALAKLNAQIIVDRIMSDFLKNL